MSCYTTVLALYVLNMVAKTIRAGALAEHDARLTLQNVCAQHGRQRKGWTHLLAFGVVRRDRIDQRLPWDDFVHLLYEIALAGFLHAQAKIKAYLFHRSMLLDLACIRHTGAELSRVS